MLKTLPSLFVSLLLIAAGWPLSAQEISWSAPQMKPEGDRSATPEAWLGSIGDLSYLALAGEDNVHLLQIGPTGLIKRSVTPDLKIYRSQGRYLYSSLMGNRLLVFAATTRGKNPSYVIHVRSYRLPEMEPLINWKRLDTGPMQLGEYVGSAHVMALQKSPKEHYLGLLSAAYPNSRIKGRSMIGLVVDSNLQVVKRHLIHAKSGDPLPQPAGFVVDDSAGMLLYQIDPVQGRWHGKYLTADGRRDTLEVGDASHFIHSGLLIPRDDHWDLIGFYGEGQALLHDGLFRAEIQPLAGHPPSMTVEAFGDRLPPRMTKDARYSLDLQPFAYQPTHWLPGEGGQHFLVAEQRLMGAGNDPALRQQVKVSAPGLFPQLRDQAAPMFYQGIWVWQLNAAGKLQSSQFIPHKGPAKKPLHHQRTDGMISTLEDEQGLGYSAAAWEGRVHLLFNDYREEVGRPLSARSTGNKFKLESTALIHWQWNGQEAPRINPLFDNKATQIHMQPFCSQQLAGQTWWLYASAKSPRQFFFGWLNGISR